MGPVTATPSWTMCGDEGGDAVVEVVGGGAFVSGLPRTATGHVYRVRVAVAVSGPVETELERVAARSEPGVPTEGEDVP